MIISGARIVTDGMLIDGKDIVVNGDTVTEIKDHNSFEKGIDLGGCFLTPGLIDMHCHGGAGYEFIDANPDAFYKRHEAYAVRKNCVGL